MGHILVSVTKNLNLILRIEVGFLGGGGTLIGWKMKERIGL